MYYMKRQYEPPCSMLAKHGKLHVKNTDTRLMSSASLPTPPNVLVILKLLMNQVDSLHVQITYCAKSPQCPLMKFGSHGNNKMQLQQTFACSMLRVSQHF